MARGKALCRQAMKPYKLRHIRLFVFRCLIAGFFKACPYTAPCVVVFAQREFGRRAVHLGNR
jgi:hypothetical protein